MARHVFQYDKMDTDVGLYLGDPSALPPLRPTPEQAAASASNPSGAFERPPQADNAGLHSGRQQGRSNTGAAHRQEAIERRQREELEREGAVPVVAEAQVQSVPSAPPVVQARVVR